MTDTEKQYLDRGNRGQEDVGPLDAENEAWIPTPFGGEDVDPNQDQTMSQLDEALEAATDGGDFNEVDGLYDGESDAPGEPS